MKWLTRKRERLHGSLILAVAVTVALLALDLAGGSAALGPLQLVLLDDFERAEPIRRSPLPLGVGARNSDPPVILQPVP